MFDTLSRVIKGEENSADTIRALYRHTMAPLKALGVTVLRLDHHGKDITNGARGSSAKGDDVDTVWSLSARPDGLVRLTADLQRSGHHPECVEMMRITFGGLRHVRADGIADPKVSAALRDLDAVGVPLDAGRDKAREMLAAAGIKIGNEALSRALAERKNVP